MAGLQTGVPARNDGYQGVQYLRTSVTFNDNGVVKTMGTIPAGSQILNTISGVFIRTVFNAGTTNVIDVGSSADGDLYATDIALGTKAFVALDEAATATGVDAWYIAADTTFTTTVALSGTAATTGAAEVVIAYLPPN